MPAAAVFTARFSRFVVDLNRARDEGGPNGVIKVTDFSLRPLYRPGYAIPEVERERRLREYYDPFHRAVETRLAAGGIRLYLDGHSMTARGPQLGPDSGEARPALCLGNFGDTCGDPTGGAPVSLDPDLARPALVFAAAAVGRAFPAWRDGDFAALNRPFDGGYLLKRYTAPDFPHRVPGLMCEINRALYFDEEKAAPRPGAIPVWREIMLGLARFLLARL